MGQEAIAFMEEQVGLDGQTALSPRKVSADTPLPVTGVISGSLDGVATETTQQAIQAIIGAVAQTAWASGDGTVIQLLKTLATAALDTNAAKVFPLPATPVSGMTASAMTGTTSTAITGMSNGGTGVYNYITQITVSNSHATVGTNVEIQDGNGGTTFYTIPAAAVYGGATLNFPTPLKQPTANTALYCKNTTTGASVMVSVTGFQA